MPWSPARFHQEEDPDVVLAAAAEALGKRIGVSRAFYGEIDANGDTIHIALDWTDGVPSAVGTYPFGLRSRPVQRMLREGVTVVEDVDDPQVDEELRLINKANHSFAWIAVPLLQGGRPVALVAVTHLAPRRFSEADIAFVREVGDRTWQALAHSRTLARLRESQAAMDARAEHERFFQAISDEIRDDRDPASIMIKVATMLATHLGASSASFSEIEALHPRVHDVYHYATDTGPAQTTLQFRMPDASAAYQRKLDGGNVLRADDATSELDPELRAFLTDWQVGSFISAPILEGGRLAVILSVQDRQARVWSEADVRLVRDLAERTSTMIARARAEVELAERERNQALLIGWNDAVRDETDPERIIVETLSRLDAAFGSLSVSFSEVDATGTLLDNIHVWQDGAIRTEPLPFSLSALQDTPLARLDDDATIRIDDVATDLRFTPASRETFARHAVASVLVAPILDGDRPVAMIAMHSNLPRCWTKSERQVLRDLAGRVWSTLERVRAEIALARSRTALSNAEKIASLGTVLAGISHELNNPLAVVIAQAELIALLAQGTPLAERAAMVHEAGDRCARIVSGFLAIARETPPDRRRVAINDVVVRAVRQVSEAAIGTAVVPELELGRGLPDLLADADQLHQIVVNLLVNAAHAVVPSQTAEVRVLTGSLGQQIIIDVKDNGLGVPDAVRSRIFEPFFTSRPAGEGAGMGLALAQGFAEMHGGTLELMPSDGGAWFRLTLPVLVT